MTCPPEQTSPRLEQDRQFWVRAAGFPIDKDAVYPEHAAVQEFHLAQELDVLEYGCGGGSDGRSYLRAGAQSVTFADIVPFNLEAAKRLMQELLEPEAESRARFWWLERSDALPDGPFDVVNAHGVLHHIEEAAAHATLCAMRKVLRPSGRLYVMLYTELLRQRCDETVAPKVAAGTPEDEAFGSATDGHGCIARWYTEESGKATLEAAGFRVRGAPRVYNDGDFRTFVAEPA